MVTCLPTRQKQKTAPQGRFLLSQKCLTLFFICDTLAFRSRKQFRLDFVLQMQILLHNVPYTVACVIGLLFLVFLLWFVARKWGGESNKPSPSPREPMFTLDPGTGRFHPLVDLPDTSDDWRPHLGR